MSLLQMVELRLDMPALLRFLRDQGLDPGEGDDLGYGVHAWLAAAFGPMAPKPWRLLVDRRRPTRILGYSLHNAEELRQRLHDFSHPGAFAVCAEPDTDIASRPMPAWKPGRRLGFELQFCPVGRKARTGVEKDLFLLNADAAPAMPLQREAVYCDWIRTKLQQTGAANVTAIGLAGFQLVRQTRQSQGPGRRSRSHPLRPQALVRGELTILDPDAFSDLLARGVGRHRSFGYGMLLLRPPS